MSFAEFRQWQAYRERRGSLNVGMRVEWGSAQLAALYATMNSKRPEGFTPYSFATHHDEPELSLEQAMETWT